MPDPVAPSDREKAPGARCNECPNARGRMMPPAPAREGAPRLVVVGEAPCAADFDNGGIFRSSGGRMLDRELGRLGLRRGEVHLTNAILCSGRFKDYKHAAKACAPRLAAELAALPLEVPAVTFDSYATRYALGWRKSTPIAKWRGAVARPAEGEGRLVLPMLHPVEVRRAPKWAPVWEGDWERVGRVLEVAEMWRAPEESPTRRLLIPSTIREARLALAELKGPEVAGDVETVGLGPTETALVCLGYSDGAVTVVLPWSEASNGLAPFWPDGGRAVVAATNEMLRVPGRVLVTHNGPSFDHIVFRRYGFDIEGAGGWDDTLGMTHVLAGHLPKNLAHVVTANAIDAPPWKMLEDRGVALDRLWVYNGRDCLYTILAYRALAARLWRVSA